MSPTRVSGCSIWTFQKTELNRAIFPRSIQARAFSDPPVCCVKDARGVSGGELARLQPEFVQCQLQSRRHTASISKREEIGNDQHVLSRVHRLSGGKAPRAATREAAFT